MKVVGFSIEIKGQKNILATTKVLGLLNTQLILINNSLVELYKNAGTASRQLNKQFKSTSSSAKNLGTVVKSSFQTFEKGNKVVQDMGSGFAEVTKQVDKTAKEFQELDKATDSESKSIKDLIKRNKELKKVLQEQPIDKTSKQLKELSQEYTKNNDAIKAFRKELRTGKKASDAAEGSLDQLRKRAIDLKKEYNALSDQQRKTFAGRKIQSQLLKTQKRIQKLDLAVRDGRTSIGLYRNATKKLGSTLTKVFIGRSVIAGVGRAVGSLGRGLKTIAEEGGAAGKTFEGLQSSGARLQNTLKTAGSNLLGAFGGTIAKIIDNVSFVISKVSSSLTEASESGGLFGTVINGVGEVLRNFPAIFGGIISVIFEFGAIFKRTFSEISLQTQKLILNIKKVGTVLTGGDTAAINKRLQDINNQLKDNVIVARSLGDAYKEGYENTIKAQEEFQQESIKATEAEEKRLQQAKEAEEAEKQRATARKKRREEEKKDRAEALKEIEAQAQARIQIAIDLEQQLRTLQIGAIKDSTEKALAEEKERFNQEKKLRQQNFDSVINQIIQQEAKIEALFGSASQELIQFQKDTDAQLFQINQTNNQIAEQQEKQHQEALLQIQKDGDKAKLDAQKQAFDDIVAELEAEEEAELEAEGQKSDAIIAKQIEGYNKEAEAAKQAEEEELAKKKKQNEELVQLVNASFDAINTISEIAFEAEDARFAKAIETRKANLENLNEDLQNATGLQKKFLKQQVKQEKEALAEELKAREEAEKERAKQAQTIALVQAIINGAIAITRAFSDLGPIAGAVAAIGVAAGIAVQIATISSQKFAQGGILQGPSHAQGGIQTSFGELEGGEAVINKRSTSQFLPLLSEINAAGGGKRFAEGGILTSPISAPNVGSAQTDINASFNQFLQASMQQTQATNSRIDRLQVNLDLNNLEDVQDNDANLDTLTTF
jgi:hypothetical protein